MVKKTDIPHRRKLAEPITNLDEVEMVRLSLVNKPRDLLLFDIAIQTGLPVEQWLNLKVNQLQQLSVGDDFPVQSHGRGSDQTTIFNGVIKQSFDKFIRETRSNENDFLFSSRKGTEPLTLSSVSRIVKQWFDECGLEGKGGILSLRKTWETHFNERATSNPQTIRKKAGNESLSPIHIPTRQEVVYRELEKVILSGRIRPGERIISEDIAKRLQVSKIPVREALGRLEARGFISTKPNWGYIVNELSKENLEEILKLRINLECLAAEEALSIRDPDIIAKLEFNHDRFAVARSDNHSDQLLSTNKEFHFTLYQASKMPILLGLIDQLWDRVSPYYHILFRQSVKPNPVAGIHCHREILNAFKKGDNTGVIHWLKTDLIDSTNFVLNLFEIFGQK